MTPRWEMRWCKVCKLETEQAVGPPVGGVRPSLACCNDHGACGRCGRVLHAPEDDLAHVAWDRDGQEVTVCAPCLAEYFDRDIAGRCLSRRWRTGQTNESLGWCWPS